MNDSEKREAAQLTLRPYFERFHAPNFLIDAKQRSLARCLDTIKHWERLTANPPLCEIDTPMLTAFLRRLRGLESPQAHGDRQLRLFCSEPRKPSATSAPACSLAAATCNCHRRNLISMLLKAGPAGAGNLDALGVLPAVAWVKPLRVAWHRPRTIADDVLTRIYHAAAAAQLPRLRGISAGRWWQTLIFAALITAYRRGGLLRIRWDWVRWKERQICLAAEADKRGRDRSKPVTASLLAALMKIRTADPLVFPWPHSEATWYRQWHWIQRRAGLIRGEQIRFHDLKRACGSRLARVAPPDVLREQLDHADLRTTLDHYASNADVAQQYIDRFPVPPGFEQDQDISAEQPKLG